MIDFIRGLIRRRATRERLAVRRFRLLSAVWFKGAEDRRWQREDDARREAVGADEWARKFLEEGTK